MKASGARAGRPSAPPSAVPVPRGRSVDIASDGPRTRGLHRVLDEPVPRLAVAELHGHVVGVAPRLLGAVTHDAPCVRVTVFGHDDLGGGVACVEYAPLPLGLDWLGL